MDQATTSATRTSSSDVTSRRRKRDRLSLRTKRDSAFAAVACCLLGVLLAVACHDRVSSGSEHDSTARSYDLIAAEYARANASVPSETATFREAFVARVRAGGVVADLGCGPGRDALFFASAGLHVIGIDASGEMVRLAVTNGADARMGDLRQPDLAPGSVDGIWSSASLLHVPRRDVPRTLRAWHRALAPGGVLGLVTSTGVDEGWEHVPYDPGKQAAPSGVRRWFVHHEKPELLGLLADAGFHVDAASERVSHRVWLQVLASPVR